MSEILSSTWYRSLDLITDRVLAFGDYSVPLTVLGQTEHVTSVRGQGMATECHSQKGQ